MRKRVADVIVETIVKHGITDCFSVVGGGAMHLNNAFEISNDINVFYCHHEQACTFAAEGYAKYNNKMAAVCVTSGPGGVNALNGVYGAYVDSIPMIVISGHPRYDTTVDACGLNLRCRGIQEYDIISSVKPMTKYACMVTNPLTVKSEIEKAINIANSGRKGPVWISVPLNIQSAMVEDDDLYYFKPNEIVKMNFDYTNLYDILKNSKRPCILAGHGIREAGAISEFYKLIEKLDIPVVGGAITVDLLPEGYKNYYGMSGNIGPRTGNYILQRSDTILILGDSLATRQTGFNLEGFAPDSTKIMIDIDKDEMIKPDLHIDYKINMDLIDFMNGFISYIDKPIHASNEWISYCDGIYKFFEDFDTPEIPKNKTIPAKLFWKILREKTGDETVLALGNSSCCIGIYQYGIKKMGQRAMTNINAGSMGDDLPEAVGAAVASGKDTVCVTGDGSVMMNLQELQTIKFNDLPIKVVIFSNKGYGAIRQTCSNYFDGTYTGCDPDSGISFPSFKKVAEAFEFKYIYCDNVDELESSIDRFMSESGQVIFEIEQDFNDTVIPKIVSRLRPDGTFEKPDYTQLSPFLSDQQQEEIDEIEKIIKGDN